MHEIQFLKDTNIIFGLASLVVFLFNKFKIPSVIGFLLTGIIAGPYALALINDIEIKDVLAEIGVILLLFIIGIELSISKLVKMKNVVFLGGGLQVGLTILSVFSIVSLTGVPYKQAVFIGFLVALSSTPIILKILQERDQIDEHHGKISLGILIFQDLIIVPMMLFVPFLTGQTSDISGELLLLLGKSVLLIGLTYLSARWFIPYILHKIAISNSQELFLISIILIGFAVASFSAWLGLSLALGAFLAGLAISESEYSHQAIGNLIPFRDIFTSFFFVSIGMLLDVEFLISNLFIILSVPIIVILLKLFLVSFVSFILGYPFRIAFRTGLVLAQIGEFSFILAKIGQSNHLIDDYIYQLFLAIAILSMSITPILIIFSSSLSRIFEKLPLPQKIRKGLRKLPDSNISNRINEHTILVGKSESSSLTKSFELAQIPFVVIDIDADRIRDLQKNGMNAVYGHAQYESVLEHANIKSAKSLLIYVSDTGDKVSIIKMAKSLNPNIQIIVRTQFIEDIDYLYEAGADEVIPDEFELSLEMFAKVLTKYLVPLEEIEKTLALIRAEGYDALRSDDHKAISSKIKIPDFEISTLIIHKASLAYQKSIKDLDLRNKTGLTILAVKKQEQVLTNPSANTVLDDGDIVYVLGNHYDSSCINEIFKQV